MRISSLTLPEPAEQRNLRLMLNLHAHAPFQLPRVERVEGFVRLPMIPLVNLVRQLFELLLELLVRELDPAVLFPVCGAAARLLLPGCASQSQPFAPVAPSLEFLHALGRTTLCNHERTVAFLGRYRLSQRPKSRMPDRSPNSI